MLNNWITKIQKGNFRPRYRLNNPIRYICQKCSQEHYWSWLTENNFLPKKQVEKILENDYCLWFLTENNCKNQRFLNQSLCYDCCNWDCKDFERNTPFKKKT